MHQQDMPETRGSLAMVQKILLASPKGAGKTWLDCNSHYGIKVHCGKCAQLKNSLTIHGNVCLLRPQKPEAIRSSVFR